MPVSNYDKFPATIVKNCKNEIFTGYQNILNKINLHIKSIDKEKVIVAIDCYPGVNDNELIPAFKQRLAPELFCNTLDIKLPEENIFAMIRQNLTDDRVFGVMSCHKIEQFFNNNKIKAIQNRINQCQGKIVLLYGFGASLIARPDILVYADMPRWEIQQRFRSNKLGNWGCNNSQEDILKKYKRGFFVEWRVADRHKISLFDQIDYFLDTTIAEKPAMLTAKNYWQGLQQTVNQPFRVVPFFDRAPWGGQWMKEICDLDRSVDNYGWCFDCVPEENSLYLQFGNIRFETPSTNLVFKHPSLLLGEHVYGRFGAEFPIRFDFLDTMGGGNLSFQVHPLTEYIQQNFSMPYTQDESYYILDAGPDSSVYLGLKTDIDPAQMIQDLETAQNDPKQPFNAGKYANNIPAKKHDHFLIPAGTTHCSGANTMVLEISATPYIFTFKLWDWGRLGLDSLPRPVHINHGKHVIQWDRNTQWVNNNLINQIQQTASGDGWKEERTGLHRREFIETRRHWFTAAAPHCTEDSVNVLNLIEGRQAIIESPDHTFEPFEVHYAETFIIPAHLGKYTIRPHDQSVDQMCGTIKAYIR
ncbi:MAG: class I mannose-6-phosphate isomerase [Phycisphaerae bacterium]|nr:class I mannose-6-phosphate isomerase [Phycisphaerae bacterium]